MGSHDSYSYSSYIQGVVNNSKHKKEAPRRVPLFLFLHGCHRSTILALRRAASNSASFFCASTIVASAEATMV